MFWVLILFNIIILVLMYILYFYPYRDKKKANT